MFSLRDSETWCVSCVCVLMHVDVCGLVLALLNYKIMYVCESVTHHLARCALHVRVRRVLLHDSQYKRVYPRVLIYEDSYIVV